MCLEPGVIVIGIDIVEVSRIEAVTAKHGERFLRRVFTEGEVRYAREKKRWSESLAVRFAAKEAFMKAWGRRLPWREIEVVRTGGRPFIRYRGTDYAGLSISHERTYAVAVVVMQEKDTAGKRLRQVEIEKDRKRILQVKVEVEKERR